MTEQARSIEVSGVNADAAIEDGLARLGVPRDQVEVEVIQEASRGVLGIGAREAVVRISVRTLPVPEIESGVEVEEKVGEEPEPQPVIEPAPPPDPQVEALELAKEVLTELLEHMQINAQVHTRVSKPKYSGDSANLVLDIHGQDLGFLIGRKGETLAAMQHLVRLVVNKALQRRVNLMLDVEGYRERREAALRKLALRIADQSTRRNRRIALEPMNAYERRIIHISLRNHPTVVTESVGEGTHRKVTILPKR